MSKYRNNLPQLNGGTYLTDGGLETTLIFHNGFDLPHFAAFDLLKDEKGRKALHDYYVRYSKIACDNQTGFILESATWRASTDWGVKLGYDRESLERANMQSIEMLQTIRNQYENASTPMVISGCIGPRGDGYKADDNMTVEQAEQYHTIQINSFNNSGADMISAITMNNTEEAIGIVRAAQAVSMPCTISFTVETDGCLPTGQSLKDAIMEVDEATDNGPVYYMINCAHPQHFDNVLGSDESWLNRIHGIRANASCKSHAELDEATELDDGDPQELGKQYRELTGRLVNLNVLGGCCGTDHRHIEQICHACLH